MPSSPKKRRRTTRLDADAAHRETTGAHHNGSSSTKKRKVSPPPTLNQTTSAIRSSSSDATSPFERYHGYGPDPDDFDQDAYYTGVPGGDDFFPEPKYLPARTRPPILSSSSLTQIPPLTPSPNKPSAIGHVRFDYSPFSFGVGEKNGGLPLSYDMFLQDHLDPPMDDGFFKDAQWQYGFYALDPKLAERMSAPLADDPQPDYEPTFAEVGVSPDSSEFVHWPFAGVATRESPANTLNNYLKGEPVDELTPSTSATIHEDPKSPATEHHSTHSSPIDRPGAIESEGAGFTTTKRGIEAVFAVYGTNFASPFRSSHSHFN